MTKSSSLWNCSKSVMFAPTRVVLAGLKDHAQQSKSIQLCLFSTWNQARTYRETGAMTLNEQFCMTLPPNRSINQQGRRCHFYGQSDFQSEEAWSPGSEIRQKSEVCYFLKKWGKAPRFDAPDLETHTTK